MTVVSYPPSSPTPFHINESISSDYLPDDSKRYFSQQEPQRFTILKGHNDYPTPNPSSSTGTNVQSSPNNKIILKNRLSSDDREDFYSDLKEFNQLSSHSSDIASPAISNIKYTQNININPYTTSHFILGRKKSVCDIHLPSLKTISRQHAILSYNDNTRQLCVTCLGTNGMVILFPNELNCYLSQTNIDEAGNASQINNFQLIQRGSHPVSLETVEKPLLQNQNITSFALLKDESVKMPPIDKTILNFRDAEIIINISIPTSQDVDNDTQTEDEMSAIATKSDDFISMAHTPTKVLVPVNLLSPSTEKESFINQCSSPARLLEHTTVTPLRLVETNQPTTPIKPTKDLFDKERCIYLTSPIPKFKGNKHRNYTKGALLSDPYSITDIAKDNLSLEHIPEKEKIQYDDASEVIKKSKLLLDLNILRQHSHDPMNKKFDTSSKKDIPFQKNIFQKSIKVKTSKRTLSDSEQSPIDQKKKLITLNRPVNIELNSLATEKIDPVKGQKQPKQGAPIGSSINVAESVDKSTERLIKSKFISEITCDLIDRNIELTEIKRLLVNNLAFSNLQQTPLTNLLNINGSIKTLAKNDLRIILESIRCIGVIHRHGKDAAGKPLEEEYYYNMDYDSDDERKNLVSTMKGGRSGLRSCRKVHKQYFWKKPPKKGEKK